MNSAAPFEIKAQEPNNTSAEAAVLGSCLAHPRVFDRLQGALERTDFYEAVYADTWKAMQEMAAQNRRADLITLAPLLKDRKVGDAFAIEHLQLLVEIYGSGKVTLSHESLDAYVSEIRRYAAQRRIAEVARELNAKALALDDPDLSTIAFSAVEAMDAALDRTRPSERTCRRAGDFAAEALRRAMDDKAPKAAPTGMTKLDAMTGGLYRGELSILAGRPSMGKTSVAAQIALNAAKAGIGTLMVSLEMGGISVTERMLSAEAFDFDDRVPYTWFRTDVPAIRRQMARLDRANERLKKLPLVIEEKSGLSVGDIGALVRRVKTELEKDGCELGLVVVDYLGLITPSERYKGSKVNEVGEISASLKHLAKREDIHVQALHQLNRELEKRPDKRPQLHDLRDSGSIEQDADLILFAFRPVYYLERQGPHEDETLEAQRHRDIVRSKNILELAVAKQRAGNIDTIKLFCAIECSHVADPKF